MARRVFKKRLKLSSAAPVDDLPQRTIRREKRNKTLRRTMVFSCTVVLLAVGSGLAYSWYQGTYNSTTIKAAPTAKKRVKRSTPKVDQNAVVGASIQSTSAEVKRGDNATVTIRTNPLASCDIAVTYGALESTDSGLLKKQADEYGLVTWSWKVDDAAQPGVADIAIECRNAKNSAEVEAEIPIL